MRCIKFELKHYDTVTRLVRAVVRPWLAVTKAVCIAYWKKATSGSHRSSIPAPRTIDEPYAQYGARTAFGFFHSVNVKIETAYGQSGIRCKRDDKILENCIITHIEFTARLKRRENRRT
jgi:hypothetical protein